MWNILTMVLPIVIGLLTGQVNDVLGWVLGGGLFAFMIFILGMITDQRLDRERRELERLGRVNPITVLLSDEEADQLRRLRTRPPEPLDPFKRVS